MFVERYAVPERGVLSVCVTRTGDRLTVMRTARDFEIDLLDGCRDEPYAVIHLDPDEADVMAGLLMSQSALDRLAAANRAAGQRQDRR